jgi:hypothetical protein
LPSHDFVLRVRFVSFPSATRTVRMSRVPEKAIVLPSGLQAGELAGQCRPGRRAVSLRSPLPSAEATWISPLRT